MQNDKWNFNNTYCKLPNLFFREQYPTPVSDPELVIFNKSLASSLGIPHEPTVFAGNVIPKGAKPIAQAYAGHQFGHFTMLGDGRAVLLGEQVTGERFDIQLKGSGPTKFSRGGDGRAALGPMLREYIISEAMHALGIPTTRSLAVVKTGEIVIRERHLPVAILTRIAKSHIRVGTFEYAAYFGTVEDVRCLADYTIERHFPKISTHKNKYLLMLKEVIKLQASLISRWQLVGFIHGVMNTDNMSICGETIDYGPCAFMDIYNPATVFSSIDTHGRYSYENQPKMAVWNLARFAETILPLLHENEDSAISIAHNEIACFWDLYQNNWLDGMCAKLGLYHKEAGDELLVNDLLALMERSQADFTNTFRSLTLDKKLMLSSTDFKQWNARWQARLEWQAKSESEVKALMKRHNPSIIPRNLTVEQALETAEEGDLTMFNNLLQAVKNPYEYTAQQEEYALQLPPAGGCYKTFCGT